MKTFLVVITFFLSLNSFAENIVASAKINLSQEQRFTSIHLESDEYKNIYEYQTVDSICKRDIWNNRCTRDEQGWNCSDGTCSPSSYDICYSSESYGCKKTESVFVRKDFIKTHVHEIDVKIDEKLDLKTNTLDFIIEVSGEKVSIKLENSYKEDLLRFEKINDGNKTQINIIPVMTRKKAENFKAVAIKDLSFKNGNLSFKIKDAVILKDFIKVIGIQIEKKRLFSDKVIFFNMAEEGGELMDDENDLSYLFTCTNTYMPCITNGRYDIFVTAKIDLSNGILNISDYSYLKNEIKAEVLKTRP